MILTDREWLRFVTFGIVVGACLGALYTGALVVLGHTLAWAVAGGVIGTGVMAVLAHVALRYVLDRSTDPRPDSTDATSSTSDTDTDS